jgi:hypothetical protein
MSIAKHTAAALAALLLAAGCGGSSSEEPPTPPPLATNLLPNGDLSGDNEDVWVFYDNATGAGWTSSVGDCTADGFDGPCLTASAASYYTAHVYDSALVLDDGPVAGTANRVLTLAPSKTYQVKFRARASQAAKVNLVVQTPAYVPIKAQEFDLGTTATDHETATFTTTETQATFSLQTGYAGNAGATLQFDDLQLLEQ